ncbi:FliJ domain containing protein [Pyrenophora tritici-repentis]|nr:uncharacterized protein PTRG_01314 [Pyrenophora tritici-repentis Pt-1C-BFP]KAI1513433.1 hypothetical protein Ptr86124_007335 [Pyrenophora tritici-repentis]EDU40752.1 conserved hypothetical protein [Pyrenophora tritici-repentis Pt-1C-BFP]KAI1527465.1 FliJ domain containing protein [Pyrenophora tritici-repentis]KAI1531298.1 FliJ domain containing protein [Pyrenophora tritici-repentis]KAI1566263.1 FliJ domain containing protein [Pyrenophora tritici-repentis]
MAHLDPTAISEVNGASVVQASPEGDSSSSEGTAKDAVSSEEPTDSVQGPKKLEASPEVKAVSQSNESSDGDESDQNKSDQGYESGKTNASGNGGGTSTIDEVNLTPPSSTPEQQTEHQELPVPNTSESEDKIGSAIAQDGHNNLLVASELGTVQTPKKNKVAPRSPATEVEKTTVTTKNGEGAPQGIPVTLQEPPTLSRPSYSVPPHLRPRVPHQSGLQNSRQMPPSELVRFNKGYRGQSNYPAHEPRRDTVNREQYTRISAQLMKANQDLADERANTVIMREALQEEYNVKFDAASANLLSIYIREQVDAIFAKTRFQAKEAELKFREEKIQQLEVFLAEGQMQLAKKDEEGGGEPMSAVQTRQIRREAVLATKNDLAKKQARVNAEKELVDITKKAQKTREECYKTLIRESLQAELNKTAVSKDKAHETAKVAYHDGFADGKEAGRKEVVPKPDNQQDNFLEGYRVSHVTQVLMSKLRQGKIPADSPQLDFLFDANHAYNPCTMGERLGRMEDGNVTTAVPNGNDSPTGHATTNGHASPTGNAASNSHAAPNSNASTNGHATRNTTVMEQPTTNGRIDGPVQQEPEEPVHRMPPPRLTFAAELRGPTPMHNGDFILANYPAASSSTHQAPVQRPAVQPQEGENLIDLL